jgi:hypothetical protein
VKRFNQSFVDRFSLTGIDDIVSRDATLVCLSHLQWNSVYQRPQHLLSRCAQKRRVFFVEEPVIEFIDSWWLEINQRECGVWIVVLHLPNLVSDQLAIAMQQSLMNELFENHAIANPILWYYTPAALTFTEHLQASVVVMTV